jgi:hypothetical protein
MLERGEPPPSDVRQCSAIVVLASFGTLRRLCRPPRIDKLANGSVGASFRSQIQKTSAINKPHPSIFAASNLLYRLQAESSAGQDEPCKFCAWEMFDASEGDDDTMQQEGGRLDQEVADRVSAVLEECLQGQRYNLFVVAPEPDESFPTSRGGTVPSKQRFLRFQEKRWNLPIQSKWSRSSIFGLEAKEFLPK